MPLNYYVFNHSKQGVKLSKMYEKKMLRIRHGQQLAPSSAVCQVCCFHAQFGYFFTRALSVKQVEFCGIQDVLRVGQLMNFLFSVPAE